MINSFNFVPICAVLFVFVLNVTLLHAVDTMDKDEFCLNLQRHDVEKYLSTKTPYRAIANFNETPPNYPGCSARRIWTIIRHGTRNPSKSVISDAQKDLKRLKEEILQKSDTLLCKKDLDRLRHWNFNLNAAEEKYLVAEGEDEMIELAERMQNRFPDLLPDLYDPYFYYFKYTATQRTLKSAESFATGLFGRHRIGGIIYPEALPRDPVLRFYKLCNRWQTEVDDNPKTFDNKRKFFQGPEMHDAIEYIKNVTKLDEITPEEVHLIYTICAFETAWNRYKPPSIWCNLFNSHTIRILEFSEDLDYYWNDGYGYELTHKIACPAIADMFDSIDPNSKKSNSTFYFTHSGTLLKVLAHIGLYKDEYPLTNNDFKRERSWRTSSIDAFGTNLAFILYECDNKDHMVLTMHQERVVIIPGCPKNTELCSLDTLRTIFSNSLKNCNFHEFCNIS